MWYVENTPEMKAKRKRNAHRRERNRLIREMPPKEKFEYEQKLLWWKLHTIFTKKEFVTYENLPEALRIQIEPFEEFTFP